MNPTNHPLTEAHAREMWDKCREESAIPEVHRFDQLRWTDRFTALAAMRAAYDAGREHEREHEREHADPHHDPRPWQDCTVKGIRAGDLVEARDEDLMRVGVAHHKDNHGNWFTEDGHLLTNGTYWLHRRIPALTPPAEEVELPDEPCVLTDVVLSGGEKIAEATWTGTVLLYARHPLATHLVVAPADQIEQLTLDGTRARRDGERADGSPRFVKEEK